ncbi:similar to Saccharomyces cerevisiae YGL090W LIF1 Component of the DNA ligase IV complex that mediates nonhomologous end joining in DNA double-strand break repair [Maudiozyma saulgeensis]|uniref:Similar to Saccharomyces cerevisiae YGL090W LIF1 Component of the DNA ligase IV complex that mediates nonhomologous end joining in DNA double-strand break repair n=1 Tax=Maudiozyma saulgeensis TaxID=1789683 RepID=A0A1X7QZZ1_9SACH|nr:similar to Saccharomyces cerevisiae YGL090W LIF1 Component of the DNA ligase IV complex that mediates nonhomologous end joining in DNA double-strand break repair [Kazachstania saulgeensis]
MNKGKEQEYICCIPFHNSGLAKDKKEPTGEKDICICKVLLKEPIKNDTTVQGLENFVFTEILMSEGSMISRNMSLTYSKLQTFEPYNIPGIKKINIWYSLIKLLTGSNVFVESMEAKMDYGYWQFDIQDSSRCSLVFQVESEYIVKKLAEISFTPVENAEVDLFDLTNRLFQRLNKLNEAYQKLMKQSITLKTELSTLSSERAILERILEERDKKTRTIVVELLNEKKKKIFQLEQIIENNGLETLLPESKSDSEVINTHIVDAVNELNSPGKRRRTGSRRKNYKDVKRKLKYEEDRENINDTKPMTGLPEFSPEFNFYGISKTPIEDPNIYLRENVEPLVKVEPGGEPLEDTTDIKYAMNNLINSTDMSDFESDVNTDTYTEAKDPDPSGTDKNPINETDKTSVHNKGNISTSDSEIETETSDF